MPAAVECPGVLALVDDADDFRRATHAALERAGYRVISFATAEDLLAALEGTMPPIDLFIIDLRLPGLQGEELARRLLGRDPSTRILIASGTLEKERVEGLEVGALLEKPFRVAQLLERCAVLLRR